MAKYVLIIEDAKDDQLSITSEVILSSEGSETTITNNIAAAIEKFLVDELGIIQLKLGQTKYILSKEGFYAIEMFDDKNTTIGFRVFFGESDLGVVDSLEQAEEITQQSSLFC